MITKKYLWGLQKSLYLPGRVIWTLWWVLYGTCINIWKIVHNLKCLHIPPEGPRERLTENHRSRIKYIRKCFSFRHIEIECLSFRFIKDGVKSLESQLKGMKSINGTTKVHDVHWFARIVNYNEDIWLKIYTYNSSSL